MMVRSLPLLYRLTAGILFGILFFYVLIVGRNFFIPISFSILFAFLIFPVARFFEKRARFPRIVANLVSIILGIVVIASVIFLVYKQTSTFFDDLPQLRQKALNNFLSIEKFIEAQFNVSVAQQDTWLRDQISNFFESGGEYFRDLFTATTGSLVRTGIIPVYVFFLLYYRNKFKTFILQLVPPAEHQRTNKILLEISSVTQRYMSGIVIVVAILCIINSIGLTIVGVQYALLLGILSALMNFIPYFGTLIGGAIPLLVSLVLEDSPQYALGVIILFLIIQFTENNILTPNIVGFNVRINPLFTIITIYVGGLVWGLAGMFIFLPFVAMIKILFDHITPLQPYAYLMGTEGTERHSLSWEKIRGIFRKKETAEHKN